jgi:beta-N-acetylhexosaminidase
MSMRRRKSTVILLVFCLLMAVTLVAAFSSCSDNTGNGNDQLQTEYTAAVNDSTSSTNNSSYESSTAEEGSIPVQGSSTEEAFLPASADLLIKEKINKMSLDEKIGQMFIVGFKGDTPNDEIKSMIQKYHVGGIILFRNNITDPEQMLSLINSLKFLNSKNQAALFMSVDEEGGRISRMPDQLEKLPTNEAIGKINDPQLSFNIGGVLAYELKAFGFNMDFAPVIDIFSNPKNTVIGDRAFGSEPDIVSSLGIQTMKGLQAGGVISVVKHFPGHGDTLVDSHIGLPTVDYDLKRLESFELKPFQAAIENKADAVMVAHILMKTIDPISPASMSKTMITDVLRDKMGFTGVVVTDDMTMGAIVENYNIGAAVVKSVNAGSDIILVCHGYDNQVNAINSLKSAVKNGRIAEERLNDSIYRILKLKGKYGLSDKKTTSINVDEINKRIVSTLGSR